MKHYRSVVKAPVAVTLGLLFGGIALSNVAQAGCDPATDPLMDGPGFMGHPCPQPRPGPSAQETTEDNLFTSVVTPEGHFPPQDPFAEPPGSNFLMTVYENLRDYDNVEMPNTLPSTPDNPYNLHDGPVTAVPIDKINPQQDLDTILDAMEKIAAKGHGWGRVRHLARIGTDILEGNKLSGHLKHRAYQGFPVLHYQGPNKIKTVQPIYDDSGNVVGGNVDVNMIYFNQRIEADVSLLDVSAVKEVPWTMTYHVNILHGGAEDFSPFAMLFDRPRTNAPFPLMHASMDQSFFPMLDEGTRYTVKIKQTKGKYFNLIYTWGWRFHPPRVQVIEDINKTFAPFGEEYNLGQWEREAFCEGGRDDLDCDTKNNRKDKRFAIERIGDWAPAKRMWQMFESLDGRGHRRHRDNLKQTVADLRVAFLDWTDRTKLPNGVKADPDADMTLFYTNNQIYGSRQGLQGKGSGQGPAEYKGICNGCLPDWKMRPYNYKVTLYNGDHFLHGYMSIDFGGSRGWENHFQLTDPTTLVAPHIEPPPGHPAGEHPFNDHNNIIEGTEDQLYPMNRSGVEEFLQPSARNLEDRLNGKPLLGSGCFFTFGRAHAWPNAGGRFGPITINAAVGETLGVHKVDITLNYEPSRRLRMYQFDPLHHDQAVYSLH